LRVINYFLHIEKNQLPETELKKFNPFNMKNKSIFILTAITFVTAGFANTILTQCKSRIKEQIIKVSSNAFRESEMIPAKYTCDSENVSPPLSWSKGPDSTKTYVLICDDPDAPSKTWLHWVLYNIPSSVNTLPENIPASDTVMKLALNGINDSKTLGYSGPCPPNGVHRYYFKIFALDCELKLSSGQIVDVVESAMKNHVLASGSLMGRYKRK
jgi:Raf kinase inhibitor-like YbhB/YbcL family protein